MIFPEETCIHIPTSSCKARWGGGHGRLQYLSKDGIIIKLQRETRWQETGAQPFLWLKAPLMAHARAASLWRAREPRGHPFSPDAGLGLQAHMPSARCSPCLSSGAPQNWAALEGRRARVKTCGQYKTSPVSFKIS